MRASWIRSITASPLILLSFVMTLTGPAAAADLEKDELTFGFIKLTDCAPLIIAKEKGFFEDEDLYVKLEAQANWKTLMDRVIDGELDGSHMLAPAPLGHTAGLLTKSNIVVPYVMSVNGAGISVSTEVWEKMKPQVPTQEDGLPAHPISAAAMKPVVDEFKNQGKSFKMAMTYPVGTHNYALRYWLAAGGINPGYYTATDTNGMTEAEVQLSVTPPPQMPAVLQAGTVNGICVGDPWHKQVVEKGVGVPVTSSLFTQSGINDKVFGVTKEWADANPNTLRAVTKALIRAGKWLDADVKNRDEAAKILSKPEYVGANYEVIQQTLTGTFEYEKGDKRPEQDWFVFNRNFASYPYYSDGIWWLTQVRRWGQIENQTDEWYVDLVKKVYLPDVWRAAADELIKEGKMTADEIPQTDGFRAPSSEFIDKIEFDGHQPNEYLQKFSIGRK
jgi:nitrate/nitrite transport system substrate-binding protein